MLGKNRRGQVAARAVVVTLALGAVAVSSGAARADEMGTPTLVAPAPSKNVMVSADGSYLAYSSNGLYGRPAAGGAPTLLSAAAPDDYRLQISADGSIIGFVTPSGDAHVVNRQRGTDEVIATGLASTDRLYSAELTTTVWYSKTTGSTTAVYSHDAATAAGAPNSDAALPLPASPSAFVVDWQGSRVLYSTADVYTVRQYTVAGGADQVVLTGTSLIRDHAAISSTGRYLTDGTLVFELSTGRLVNLITEANGAFTSAFQPRFSLDERWVAFSGGFHPGVWVYPVVGPHIAYRVAHANEISNVGRFPVSIDPTGGNVAFTSIVDASGPTFATYTSPVMFDTTPPQVTILTREGEFIGPDNPFRVRATDGGSGIDRIVVQRVSYYGTQSDAFSWTPNPSSLLCANDAAGVRDDRDCVLSLGTYLFRGGDYTVTVVAVDVDGNQSAPETVHVHSDTTAPTVTGTPDRSANPSGWYNAPVTVSWSASDPDSPVTNPPSTTVSGDGANQVVRSASVCDSYGNCGSGSYTLSIDQVAPAVRAAADAPPGASGWYTAPVRVGFTCSDALSGVASCPAPVTVSTEGRDQIVHGTGSDRADNATDAQTSVSIDMTPPSSTVTSGSLILAAMSQRFTGTAADATSGVARVDVVMSNGLSSATASSIDNSLSLACNAARTSCAWSVRPTIKGNVTFQVRTWDVAGHPFQQSATAYVL